MRKLPTECINRELKDFLETTSEGASFIKADRDPVAVLLPYDEYLYLTNIETKYLIAVAETLDSGNQWVNKGDTVNRLLRGLDERK